MVDPTLAVSLVLYDCGDIHPRATRTPVAHVVARGTVVVVARGVVAVHMHVAICVHTLVKLTLLLL
jgi:hypothetical protein